VELKLYDHQLLAATKLRTGSILCGGVGSGKTLTSLWYYYHVECDDMKKPKDLYVITTAAKRDTGDWKKEHAMLEIGDNAPSLVVDSWNNIRKYTKVKNCFFLFDEQRLVGSGSWVRSFYKIAKNNNWILLSATPGDTWMDYIPVMVANRFYNSKAEFQREHVVYKGFTKYPKIDHYVEEDRLRLIREELVVDMEYIKPSVSNYEIVHVDHDEIKMRLVVKNRWNPFTNMPIKDVSEYCSTMRKVANSDPSRFEALNILFAKHDRIIVFYNFNYELDILRELKSKPDFEVAEHNGHKHEPVPSSKRWVYLVQYNSGAEGWNCIETNCVVFYSQSYSYRVMKQAAGRIDRLNSPFANLYYYTFKSSSLIDRSIARALNGKKNFNERSFETRK
jgi:hypothetical protein